MECNFLSTIAYRRYCLQNLREKRGENHSLHGNANHLTRSNTFHFLIFNNHPSTIHHFTHLCIYNSINPESHWMFSLLITPPENHLRKFPQPFEAGMGAKRWIYLGYVDTKNLFLRTMSHIKWCPILYHSAIFYTPPKYFDRTFPPTTART